jgi:hypothetical protein
LIQDKAKPTVRQGRKTTDLDEIAGLPWKRCPGFFVPCMAEYSTIANLVGAKLLPGKNDLHGSNRIILLFF